MAYYFMFPSVGDIFLFLVVLSLLIMSVYIGRYLYFYRPQTKTGGDLVVTLGTLSLSILLLGFAFSVSINGFITLQKTQFREAQSVQTAWQYTLFLPERSQQRARGLLRKYLDERIRFYRENTVQGGRIWSQLSESDQQQLWELVVDESKRNSSPVIVPLLSSYNRLRYTLQDTTAVCRRKIPDAAWMILILFSMMACCAVGRENANQPHNGLSVLMLPLMMSLSLFLIAEIDVPGEGMIRVTPDDLEHVALTLPTGQDGVSHDPTHTVFHGR